MEKETPLNKTESIQVSIYDDNPVLRSGLTTLFHAFNEINLLAAYPDANQVIENTKYRKPDVILMDIDMPGLSGINAVGLLHAQFPEVKVLMMTVFDDDDKVYRSICNGAAGYILKKTDPVEIIMAIKDVHAGGAPMTPAIASKVLTMFRQYAPPKDNNDLNERENSILTLLTQGQSYKMISDSLDISIDTVRYHIKKIYEKLQVHSMTEAVSKALKNKWV